MRKKNAIAKWFKNHRPVNKDELEYERALQEQLGVNVPGAKTGGRRKRSKRSKPSKRTTRRHKKIIQYSKWHGQSNPSPRFVLH
jgi:hypothetical protein